MCFKGKVRALKGKKYLARKSDLQKVTVSIKSSAFHFSADLDKKPLEQNTGSPSQTSGRFGT